MENKKLNHNSEPIKHHYIPQFILKNFTFNKERDLYYYSKKTDKITIKKTSDIFLVRNLYRSETLNAENPIQIEYDFAKYEKEIADIISEKILNKHEIVLTTDEESKLKLFCALLGLRSRNASEIFLNLSEKSKEYYKKYQEDGNFEEMWKRNLSYIVKCRSIEEVESNSDIDLPFKVFMKRDTEFTTNTYFSFLERRGNLEFIIGDCYPVNVFGECYKSNIYFKQMLFNVFPLSPELMMLQIANGAEAAPAMYNFKKFCKMPERLGKELHYHVQRAYELIVSELDELVFKNAKYGCAFNDEKINIKAMG